MTRVILSVWLLVAAACSPQSQHDKGVKNDMHSTTWTCDNAVAAIRARDFIAWRGLAGTCKDAVLKAFPPAYDGEGQIQLGSEGVRVAVLRRKAPGYSHTLDVQTASGAVVRVDIEHPELAGPVPALLSTLGAPDGKLDYYDGVLLMPGGQQVWPARGLALYLDETGAQVKRIALFKPTDLAHYRRELEPDLRIHEE
ncbi:MAG TPA: hypothetical protein VNO30_18910 [Kofleriaceae bacterium]|nr:hypothetical protein [Kofleriaceae bacterium]